MPTTQKVARFDRGHTGKAIRLDNGFLRVPATLGKVGVLTYRRPNGKIVRELRLPEELFKMDSLRTLEMVPVTNDHPAGDGFVRSENAKEVSVGYVGDRINHDTQEVTGSVMVTDADAVRLVEEGKQEISPGYLVRHEHSPGVHPTYGAYDVIQRDIEYNHVAIVDKGRAGPQVTLHLDSAMEVEQTNTPKERPMETITINGVDFEVSKAAAQAFKMDQSQAQAKLDSAQASQSTLEAERDSLKSELDKAKVVNTDAEDPTRIADLVKGRVALLSVAAPILNKDAADLMDVADADLQRQVVTAVHPEMGDKVATANEAYLAAAFDLAVGAHTNKPSEGLAAVQPAAAAVGTQVKLDTKDMTLDELKTHAKQKRLDAIKEFNTLRPLVDGQGMPLKLTNAKA